MSNIVLRIPRVTMYWTRMWKGMLLFLMTLGLSSGCNKTYDWCCIREDNLRSDLDIIYADTVLPNRPLTLADVLCIAMERNLDLIVKEREAAIQREITNREMFRMLPSLTASYEQSGRNHPVLTRAIAPDGTITGGFLTRQANNNLYDITAAWSVLDFGMSFFRSRQEKNRSLASCLEYERARQNLILEIINEYWKAVVSKRAMEGARGIVAKAQDRQKDLDKQIKDRVIPEIVGLRNEDRLVTVEIDLESYWKDYETSKRRLASLMGLPPSTCYEIYADGEFLKAPEISCVEELECLALKSRPELYSQDILEQIAADEVRVALVQMFPNATLFAQYSYDGDEFVVFNHWLEAGIRASYNLLSLPQQNAYRCVAILREQETRDARLSLSIGVMTQVHLAYLRFQDTVRQFELTRRQSDIKERLLDAVRNEVAQGMASGTNLFDAEADRLFSNINTMKAYADMQIALEQLNNALGIPLYFRGDGISCCTQASLAVDDGDAAPNDSADVADMPVVQDAMR